MSNQGPSGDTARLRWPLPALVTVFTGVFLCCAGALFLYLHQSVRTPSDAPRQFLVVEPGTGLYEFAGLLVKQGLAREEWPVVAWAVLSGTANSLKSGEYQIEPHESPARILGKVSRGDIYQHKITFLEGWSYQDLTGKLRQQTKLSQQLASLTPEQIRENLSLTAHSPEGLFFPDTYFFVMGESDLDLLNRAARKMERNLKEVWALRASDITLDTSYQALILASIIQKEAMRSSEMPRISAVFHNRLKRKMRLQADPTVIYGLGDSLKGPLKRGHLKQDTPYNTYTRAGLTPGPISMPGRAALEAAVRPLTTQELYFVARGDGTHQFSNTLKEHNAAVRQFRN